MEMIKIQSAEKAFMKAAEMYCGKYTLDEQNASIVAEIIKYIDRDETFNRQSETGFRDLNKGIMLIGNPGSGKTTIIEIMQAIVRKSPLAFVKKSTAEITDEFAKSGPEFLKKLSGNYFFDDLGFERTAVHYSDKRELMQDVIFARYDAMRYRGEVTHFTSMCTFDEMINRYGQFAWSRLKQMCNIFVLGAKNNIDRRETSRTIERPRLETLPRVWMSRSEYDEFMECKRIKDFYRREAENPSEPVKFKGSGSRLREMFDRMTNKS